MLSPRRIRWGKQVRVGKSSVLCHHLSLLHCCAKIMTNSDADLLSSAHLYVLCLFGTLFVLSHYTTLPLIRLLQFTAVQCCFHHLSDFGRTNHLKKRTVCRHPHGWPDRNFPLNVSSFVGGLLSHACTIIRLYAYMMSQSRKTSTHGKS